MARPRLSGLWRHRDFLKLWAGETASVFGSLIGGTALQFTAILVLDATPFQAALLGIAALLPGFLGGLVAGVWVDRLRRRPLLIAADLGRAALLATIPLAAALDLLRMEQLYAVAFLAGILTVLFDVAYQSYLPSLVRREELVEGNSRLAASAAAAEVGAFGIAGWLVQIFTAPVAILIDAVSFVVSAVAVVFIRAREPAPAPAAQRQRMHLEIGEGLRAVLRNPVLRAIAGCIVLLECAFRIVGAVILLYATRELGLAPGVQGMIFAVGGATSLIGAMLAGRAADRLGAGPALVLGVLLTGAGTVFIPLAHGAGALAVALLVVNQLVTDPAYTVFSITAVSLRQAITPDRLLGRVNGSIRVAGLGAAVLGSLAGGLLGERIGLRATLVTGTSVMLLAALWLVLSPVRSLRDVPLDIANTTTR